jgi:hypothetical protein
VEPHDYYMLMKSAHGIVHRGDQGPTPRARWRSRTQNMWL